MLIKVRGWRVKLLVAGGVVLLASLGLKLPADSMRGAEDVDCQWPDTVAQLVVSRYKDYRVVQVQDLTPFHRSLWKSDFGRGCPGLARIDIDGNGETDLALNLIDTGAKPPMGVLLVARHFDDEWRLVELLSFDQAAPAVLWVELDGSVEYESYERDARREFPYGALLLVGYESWGRAYGIVDGDFEWIAISE